MKSVLLGVAALVAAASASAFPLDIENDARWIVLDGLPEHQGGVAWEVDLGQLRSRDLAQGQASLAVVCGVLHFANYDERHTHFALFYVSDRRGAIVPLGAPHFYGAGAEQSGGPQGRIARMACADSVDRAVAATPVR